MGGDRKPANDTYAERSVPEESGVFTWDIQSNRVYADSAMAALFGLAPGKAAAGLPVEDFLMRLHDQDRSDVAKQIRDSILTGMPYHTEYRVENVRGEYIRVTAVGRCFRDATGNPSHFAGIVFEAAAAQANSLIAHCLSAYEMARAQNNQAVAKLQLLALQELKLRG
jgi:PAS domain-containing protein